MISLFFFEVENEEDRRRLVDYMSRIVGMHFISQEATPGSLDNVQEMLKDYPALAAEHSVRK